MVQWSDVKRRTAVRHGRQLVRHETWVAILLGLATIGSAWNAFQAARWGGIQAIHYGEANAARAMAQEAEVQAATALQVDVQMYLEWTRAKAERREGLAAFLEDRFRAELRPAFEAWSAEPPEEDPRIGQAVPRGSPFERPEYRVAARERARELDAAAARSVDAARVANAVATESVATTVLFAGVLSLTGIASKLDRRALREGLMALAAIALLGGAVATWWVPRGASWAFVP